METWTSRSDPGKQTALSLLGAAVGAALSVGCLWFPQAGSNGTAGALLGGLLLCLGAAGFVLSGPQTVVVDPRARRIRIVDSNRLGRKQRTIPFGDVAGVTLGYLGRKSNFVTWYYLVLALKSGGTYPLFPPGRFFAGGSDRATVAGWKERLEGYLESRG
ncbi:MAG: hypothetical protein ACYDA8_19465 [Deferrisomatales bacterium]